MADATLQVEIDGRGARRGANEVSRSLRDIEGASNRTSGALSRQTRQLGTTRTAMTQLTRVAGPLIAAFGAREILNTANTYTTLQNQLRVVTGSTEELVSANDRLFEISQNTRQPLEATVSLYSRASIAAKELGASQDELFQLVEVTGQALAVQGGSAQEASGALRQLSQSFSSGIVRAEEFNSILEGAFPLAQAAARGLDEAAGSVGKLRNLVVDGTVTSREFFEAILEGGKGLSEQFANTQITVGQSLTVLGNSFLRMVGLVNESTGATAGLAKGIVEVSSQIDVLAKALTGTLGPQDEVNSGLQLFTTGLLVASRAMGLFGDSLITTIVTPFEAVGNALGGTAAALVMFADGEFSQAADTIEAAFADSADIVVGNFTDLRNEMIDETSETIEALIELWDAGARNVSEAAARAGEAADAATPTIDPAAAEEAAKLAAELDKQAEALRRAVDPLYVYEQQLDMINELLLTGRINEEQANAAIAQAGETYASTTAEGQRMNEMLTEAARVTEAARTPMEEYTANVQTYKDLLDAGLITQETFTRSVEESAEKMREALDEQSQTPTQLTQFAIQAARNIQSSFADFLYDPFDEGLEGMVSGFADALRRMAAEALSQQILSGFFSAVTGGASGGAGGFLASIGGAFASRAAGGPLDAGQAAIVGERGKPELFIPQERGTIVPMEQAGGGQTSVEVPVNIQNIIDPSGMVAAIDSPQGQKAVLNVIQFNPDAVKRALS